MVLTVYLEQGCTINRAYFAGKLRPLRQEIASKGQGKLTRRVLLSQDSAPAHTSQMAMLRLNVDLKFFLVSPDMAPSDFYPFTKLKSHLRSTQYGSN